MTPVLVGTLGVYVSAVIATGGFLGFALAARFWQSRGGWHVFWYMLVIAWILDLTVIRFTFGDEPWFAWLRAISLAVGLPFVLGWRTWIIFDLQLRRWLRRPVAYGEADSRAADKEETNAA